MTRVGVVIFPDTFNERDTARAVETAGTQAVSLWHKSTDPHSIDVVVIPDGLSYDDYLHCDTITTTALVMSEIMREAGRGPPILGIYNGFRILCKSHLLPGALIRSDHQKFLCRDQALCIENANTAQTRAYGADDTTTIPLKNGEGNFQAAPVELERPEGEGHVMSRYVDFNPNGSANNIAGVTSITGNVIGLTPHPEHTIEAGFGLLSLGPDGTSHRSGTDRLGIFYSALISLVG